MDSREAASAVAGWASLLADDTRATVCLALLDGRAWTLGELARHAGVAASTLSQHADQLVAAGLLVQRRQGRHRYLQIDGQAAPLIEAVAAAAGHRPAPTRSLAGARRGHALAHARTCYDHLAGTVAVAIADAMTERGLLTWRHGLSLTTDGVAWLGDLGIAVSEADARRRPALRACLDFTARRPHLAGAVGAALCHHAFTSGWITRIGTSRAVTITVAGRQALVRHLGMEEQSLRQPRAD